MIKLYTSELFHSILPQRIGHVIKRKRLMLNITQKELSARTNISIQKISKIERGLIDLRLTELEKISFGLESSIKLLVNET